MMPHNNPTSVSAVVGNRLRFRRGRGASGIAKALGAPALMSSNAKGLLAHDHPLNAGGMLFGAGQRDLLRRADIVLSLGAEFGDTEWTFYTDEPPQIGGILIRVDIDADQLDRNIKPDLAIQADATAFAEALLGALNRPPAPMADLGACAEAPAIDLAENYTRHLSMIEALWTAHPDAILVGDSAEPSYTATCAGRAPGPRQWFTGSTGFGTLGYALPAAIGAQIARPDAPVIALAGDGGALYTIPELAAAAEAGAPVILLIWNNDGYGDLAIGWGNADVRQRDDDAGRLLLVSGKEIIAARARGENLEPSRMVPTPQ